MGGNKRLLSLHYYLSILYTYKIKTSVCMLNEVIKHNLKGCSVGLGCHKHPVSWQAGLGIGVIAPKI
jgi:hypothetical protein